MNKRDREKMCSLIAEWEWNTLPGTSEAGATACCGRDLQRMFEISNEDLAFYRAWQIYGRIKDETGRDYADDFFDALLEQVEDDLETVVDQIESMAWNEFASYIASLIGKDD